MVSDESTDPNTDDDHPPDAVVVPLRVYKAIAVFSTLFAVFGIVAGFVLLDVATDRARADLAEISPLLALLGLALIALSAVVYAFSARFRTEELHGDE